MEHTELIATLGEAKQIARLAGRTLREAYAQPRRIEHKDTTINLVTQADRASEEIIISALRERFPDHTILAEESGLDEKTSGLTWLIDPLDGTTNFAHGFPVFAVSLALRDSPPDDAGGGALLGVVYDPLRDECFAAARGLGATLDGKEVRVSGAATLDRALVATGFAYDRHTAEHNNTAEFARFIRRAQGVRRAGAATLDLAYVACGRLDGFWEMGLHPWDVAAGMLMVIEAGGMVSDWAGRPGQPDSASGKQILASNGHIHAEMVEVLQAVAAEHGK